MRFDLRPVFAVLLLLPLAACSSPADDEDSIRDDLSKKGTIELMEEIERAEYEPPSDGELTEDQIEMFLEVKEREKKIQEVAAKELEEQQKKTEEGGLGGFLGAIQAAGNVADYGSAGMRAAVDLGYNPKEFVWVQGKVLEVYAADRQREMVGQVDDMSRVLIEQLEAQRDSVPEERQAELDEQIEQIRRNAEDAQRDVEDPDEPGFAHNRELVEEHREEIEKAFTDLERGLMGVPKPDE